MLDLFLKTTTTKVNPFNYTTTTNETDFFKWLDGASAVLIVLAIFAFLIVTAVCVLMIVANCKIFKKAGEDWWKALIPLYNSWVETRIAGLAWYWFLIFAGITALVDSKWNSIVFGIGLCLVSFNYCYGIAKKFGKSAGFAVLMTFLPVIGFPILAFGSAKYDANAKVDPNGIFSVKK